MKCPQCGCEKFYVKDPDDEYETYEFAWRDGNVEFSADVDSSSCPEVCDDTETFCDKCSWHGSVKELNDASGVALVRSHESLVYRGRYDYEGGLSVFFTTDFHGITLNYKIRLSGKNKLYWLWERLPAAII